MQRNWRTNSNLVEYINFKSLVNYLNINWQVKMFSSLKFMTPVVYRDCSEE